MVPWAIFGVDFILHYVPGGPDPTMAWSTDAIALVVISAEPRRLRRRVRFVRRRMVALKQNDPRPHVSTGYACRRQTQLEHANTGAANRARRRLSFARRRHRRLPAGGAGRIFMALLGVFPSASTGVAPPRSPSTALRSAACSSWRTPASPGTAPAAAQRPPGVRSLRPGQGHPVLHRPEHGHRRGRVNLAFILLYTAPAFVAVLAAIFLGEKLRLVNLALIGVSMTGVILVARSGGGGIEARHGGHRVGPGLACHRRIPVRQVGAAALSSAIYAFVLPVGALGLLPFVPFDVVRLATPALWLDVGLMAGLPPTSPTSSTTSACSAWRLRVRCWYTIGPSLQRFWPLACSASGSARGCSGAAGPRCGRPPPSCRVRTVVTGGTWRLYRSHACVCSQAAPALDALRAVLSLHRYRPGCITFQLR